MRASMAVDSKGFMPCCVARNSQETNGRVFQETHYFGGAKKILSNGALVFRAQKWGTGISPSERNDGCNTRATHPVWKAPFGAGSAWHRGFILFLQVVTGVSRTVALLRFSLAAMYFFRFFHRAPVSTIPATSRSRPEWFNMGMYGTATTCQGCHYFKCKIVGEGTNQFYLFFDGVPWMPVRLSP